MENLLCPHLDLYSDGCRCAIYATRIGYAREPKESIPASLSNLIPLFRPIKNTPFGKVDLLSLFSFNKPHPSIISHNSKPRPSSQRHRRRHFNPSTAPPSDQSRLLSRRRRRRLLLARYHTTPRPRSWTRVRPRRSTRKRARPFSDAPRSPYTGSYRLSVPPAEIIHRRRRRHRVGGGHRAWMPV
jgi:hypothetical protein